MCARINRFFFVCSATLFYLQRSSFLFAAFLFFICSVPFLYLQRFLFLFAALLFCLQRFFFACSVPFLFAAFLFCLQRFFFICSVLFLFAAFLFRLQRFFFVCSVSLVGHRTILMCSVNFWHQQDSNSLVKGGIDWSRDFLMEMAYCNADECRSYL